MIFVTSDMHFGHKNIIDHAKRPFNSVEEMNNTIITNWNNKVSNNDTVYILGDIVGYGINKEQANEMVASLKGKKIKLKGNHDSKIKTKASLFEETHGAKEIVSIKVEDTIIYMNHFKDNFDYIKGVFPDYLYLHGHSHNHDNYNMINACYDIPYYDVGVDANSFEPITFEEIFDNIKSWKEQKEEIDRCPVCGAKLVRRNGPYGPFLGCETFPACRFTHNI